MQLRGSRHSDMHNLTAPGPAHLGDLGRHLPGSGFSHSLNKHLLLPTVCLKSAAGKADTLVYKTNKQWDSQKSASYVSLGHEIRVLKRTEQDRGSGETGTGDQCRQDRVRDTRRR